MSNPYFQFKQFTIHQDRCAMKVSTDACIQGAWAPVAPSAKKMLDIGCGTGLLSLMVAQRHPDIVTDALEADADAAGQARENAATTPWGERINVIHTDAREFTGDSRYDMIISNPPFFSGDLQAQEGSRNRARHDVSLSQADLFEILLRNLDAQGTACIMLPTAEHALWEALLVRRGWHIHRTLSVRPVAGKNVNRVISIAGAFPCAVRQDDSLTIYEYKGVYTGPFAELLKPYYLYL